MQSAADPFPSAATPVFALRGLSRSFGSDEAAVQALRSIDLEIMPGEFVVLLGPSGSGKSTLMNLLGGLDRPTAGVLEFMGRDLTVLDDRALTAYRRQNLGFVFQFYNLMPSLTARENVELITEIALDPIEPVRALEMVGLGHRMDQFPSRLSGGEQQRVAIARAIAKRPRVLLCDEPTGALDSNTGRGVLEVLQELNRCTKTTVVVVTHAAAMAGMAHRVIHFGDGCIRSVAMNAAPIDAAEVDW